MLTCNCCGASTDQACVVASKVFDVFRLGSGKGDLTASHPLEYSEKHVSSADYIAPFLCDLVL